MNPHRELIAGKLRHMRRMREYLAHSHGNLFTRGIVGKPVGSLTLEESEILAAFRMRFSEFQEHLGKLLRAIAQEEEVEITGFSDVLAFAEKAEILASADDWKKARDVRNQARLRWNRWRRSCGGWPAPGGWTARTAARGNSGWCKQFPLRVRERMICAPNYRARHRGHHLDASRFPVAPHPAIERLLLQRMRSPMRQERCLYLSFCEALRHQ